MKINYRETSKIEVGQGLSFHDNQCVVNFIEDKVGYKMHVCQHVEDDLTTVLLPKEFDIESLQDEAAIDGVDQRSGIDEMYMAAVGCLIDECVEGNLKIEKLWTIDPIGPAMDSNFKLIMKFKVRGKFC